MRKFNGVFPAKVIDNVDPENSGRVKVRLSHVDAPGRQGYETWARIATVMAGDRRGTWFIPEVNDEVLVAFEAGDVRHPFVLGALWSSTDSPPETMNKYNNKKLLCSRNGVKITLDDQSGQESVIVETPGGQKVTLKDGPGALEITDSNGNSVKLATNGITVNALTKVTINASQVEVSSGISKFSGVIQCDTLISNSVVSASYSPGAGNLF